MLEKESIILNSHRKGYSMELMCDITGLTEPEIMEILKLNV
jgi:hypothetical protein